MPRMRLSVRDVETLLDALTMYSRYHAVDPEYVDEHLQHDTRLLERLSCLIYPEFPSSFRPATHGLAPELWRSRYPTTLHDGE